MDTQDTIRVGITDKGWYDFLRHRDCSRGVNFWRPSDQNVKIEPGEWLLFKLRSVGKVVGGAQFLASQLLTINQAWSRWGQANGCIDKDAFLRRLIKLRAPYAQKLQYHSYIRCLYLDRPVFLDESKWFEVPGWKRGNSNPIPRYDASHPYRYELQQLVEDLFPANRLDKKGIVVLGEKKERDGQHAFRKEILKNYESKCAITCEKTKPVLEAAHIEPYAKSHNHLPSNGLLLKSDIHKLFDEGLVSITPEDLKFHVSSLLEKKYKNGKYYYQFEGHEINVPERKELQPDPELLQKHFEKKFKR